MSGADVAPGDRWPGESARAYDAFCAYRDLRPDQRSLRGIATKTNARLATLSAWSSKFDWVGRCIAWDQYADQERRAEFREQDRRVRAQLLDVASVMLDKAAGRFETIDSSKLTIRETVQLAETAMKIERSAFADVAPQVVAGLLSGDEANDHGDMWALLQANPHIADEFERLEQLLVDLGDQDPEH